jgi:hypothetical protein
MKIHYGGAETRRGQFLVELSSMTIGRDISAILVSIFSRSSSFFPPCLRVSVVGFLVAASC